MLYLDMKEELAKIIEGRGAGDVLLALTTLLRYRFDLPALALEIDNARIGQIGRKVGNSAQRDCHNGSLR